MTKTYAGDLIEMQLLLESREPFAFSRFGDGELGILRGERSRYSEFQYDPADPSCALLRERLFESLRYRAESYYVGIPCPHCVGEEKFFWVKRESGQPERQLTWATLLVNSNYPRYRDHVLPLFAGFDVYLVCHRRATLDGLPFPVAGDFRIDNNAWKVNRDLAGQIAECITREKIQGALFLLCAGPFASILAHRLHAHSQENTYLDVGSTLDPFLFGSRGLTRRYLRGDKRLLGETCTWK